MPDDIAADIFAFERHCELNRIVRRDPHVGKLRRRAPARGGHVFDEETVNAGIDELQRAFLGSSFVEGVEGDTGALADTEVGLGKCGVHPRAQYDDTDAVRYEM